MPYWIIALVILLTGLLLAGDCFIKAATTKSNPIYYLVIAGTLWISSIYGWYWTVKEERLAIVGTLFSVLSLIGTAILGMTIFGETLSNKEWFGVGLGVISIFLLSGKL